MSSPSSNIKQHNVKGLVCKKKKNPESELKRWVNLPNSQLILDWSLIKKLNFQPI
jgi:hypothetical protein